MSDCILIIQEILIYEDYRPYHYIGEFTLLLYYLEVGENVIIFFGGIRREYFISSYNVIMKTSKWYNRPALM